jgi:hypothetical protein
MRHKLDPFIPIPQEAGELFVMDESLRPHFCHWTLAANLISAQFRERHSEVYASIRSFSWLYQCLLNSESAFSRASVAALVEAVDGGGSESGEGGGGRLDRIVSFAAKYLMLL